MYQAIFFSFTYSFRSVILILLCLIGFACPSGIYHNPLFTSAMSFCSGVSAITNTSTYTDARTNHEVCPSLLETAELAYKLTKVDWSELGSTCELSTDGNQSHQASDEGSSNKGSQSFGIDDIHVFTENILALMLIRIVAILHERSDTPELPLFRDLSTTTICRAIMKDEARRTADGRLMKEMKPLAWPSMVTPNVISQLRSYIYKTLSMYRGVYYHNCEHAHHVFLSANKLLDLILCEYDWPSLNQEPSDPDNGSTLGTVESTTSVSTADGLGVDTSKKHEKKTDPNPFFEDHTLKEDEEEDVEVEKKLESNLKNFNVDDILQLTFSVQDLTMMEPTAKRKKRPTYGIKKDSLIQLGFLFSALVHDVDHKGITNRQLVLESDELAIMYNDQSVAEQRSLAVAFTLLMRDEYIGLRTILFVGRHEFLKFRSTVIALVLCTDISSPERVQIGKSKWKEAFGEKKKEKHGHGTRRNSNDTHGTDNEDLEKQRSELARISKERNAWKSKPADPTLAEPKNKNNLVRQFFSARGSMTRSKSMNHHDSIEGEDNPTSLYGSFSDNDDMSISSDKSDTSAYSTCMESEGELSTYSLKKWNNPKVRPGSAGPNRPSRRRPSQQENTQKFEGARRFSEPHYIMSRKRKFHFRLGIRRALDLTGTTIEAYDKKCCDKAGRMKDPDQPNCLKAIVVLEHMLRAADIAANMQKWETMLKWSSNLFQELKTSFVKGRGDDPAYGWHENQIAFFESYALPLAKNLAETVVMEEDESRKLVHNVQQNNVRWMIEGRKHVQKLIRDWDEKQPKRRSAPNIGRNMLRGDF